MGGMRNKCNMEYLVGKATEFIDVVIVWYVFNLRDTHWIKSVLKSMRV